MLRRTAWIWLAGCIAWTVDAVASLRNHRTGNAAIAFVLAGIFASAWVFYRGQKR